MQGNRHLRRARRHARLGLPVPPEARHRLLKRLVLKLTWFTTGPQTDYNLAMLKAVNQLSGEVGALREQIGALREQMTSHRHQVSHVLAGVEASLRAEILGADRRGDQAEADLMRLTAAVAALQVRLEATAAAVDSLAADADTDDVAEVRSLPGSSRR